MVDILRNMTRRKLRTGLTVLGIVIGVFALVVMGAMAEKINLLVSGGLAYYGDHVTVNQSGSAMGGSAPIDTARAQDLLKVPGVAAVVPSVSLPLKANSGPSFGAPDMVAGVGAASTRYEKFTLTAAQGTLPPLSERGVVAVGSAIANEYKLHVGDTFVIRGEPFKVAAVLQTTMTAPDQMVRMNLADAQELYLQSLPPMLRGTVQASQIASVLNVYPRAGVSGDTLAARINRANIPGIAAVSPSAAKQQFEQFSTTFNLIVLGSALIALIVGALSVINTMAMSVAERVKEIGLKKAIGARTGQVLREFLFEAGAIGLLGGLIGLALGGLLVTAVNGATAGSGTVIFAITARLAVGAVLFAAALGAVAGFFPALRAAYLDPVEALRAE
jgi:putative ABC transport system permease protein